MIKAEALTLKRNGNTILQNFNFSWDKGEKIVLLGPNGSGKTTLALGLAGIIPPSSGSIFIDSKNILEYDLKSLRKKIGIVFQDPETQFVTTNVEREISFGLSNIKEDKKEIKEKVHSIIKDFNLEFLLEKDPLSLSAGEKQIVAIASVYSMEPEYIIFDEVTSFLDRKWKEKIYEIWEKSYSSLLIITQNFKEINFGERVVFLENGKITFNGSASILERIFHFSYDSSFFRLLEENKEKISQYEKIIEVFK
ncbi:MAG: energy-coupling factor ABC transporter ATP-binding protein [candidate division WOR-3 bacterium]